MTNTELAKEFLELRNLLIIGGYDQRRVAHYARLASTLLRLPIPIEALCQEGRLCEIPGVGSALAGTISEYILSGTCRRRLEWERRVPKSLLKLLEIPGVGVQTVRYLYQQCGIESLEALEGAVRQGTLRPMNARIATRLRTHFSRMPQDKQATLALFGD